jgi:hypothetical protein
MARVRKKARGAASRRRLKKPTGTPGASPPPNGAPAPDLTSLGPPLEVIAKSFAVVAMRLALGRPAEGDRRQIGARAQFLKGLGLERGEIASLLGSTPESIGELVSRAQRTRRRGRRR